MARCHQNEELIHAFGVFSFDQRENAVHYDKYSSEYDNMQSMTGFNDPYEIVKACCDQLTSADKLSDVLANKHAKVIDFGCGTGLLGQELARNGYDEVYGIDGSADMLKVADAKGLYKKTW